MFYYRKKKEYSLFIQLSRLSFNSEELFSFLKLLDLIKNKDNKIMITPMYDYNNEENENCVGINIFIRLKKIIYGLKKNDSMLIYCEDNKLKYNKLDVPKLYCSYNYEQHECDEDIVNDFIIRNYYHYKELEKNIVYSDTLIDKLNKALYNIFFVGKDKFIVSLKHNIKMFVKVNNEDNEGNNVSHSIYFSDDKNIISLSSKFAQLCLENEFEFNFKEVHYYIEEKEFFGKELFNNTKKVLYVSKDSKISDLYVTKMPKRNKDYESVTFIIKLSTNNYIFKNGYYDSYLNRYYITDYDIEDIVDLIELNVIWPENKLEISKLKNDDDWKYNIKSKLAEYGYTVKEGITREERQEALKKAIDDGMSKYEIVSFLKWLIKLNSKNESLRNANIKRQEDIEFVENYNLDKQRKIKLN